MAEAPENLKKLSSRHEAFALFLDELTNRARKRGIVIDRANFIGRKRDFIDLARRTRAELAPLGEASFEEYMKKFGIKFPPSTPTSRADRILHTLFL